MRYANTAIGTLNIKRNNILTALPLQYNALFSTKSMKWLKINVKF